MSIDFKWLEEKVFQRKLATQDRKTLRKAMTAEYYAGGHVIIMQNDRGGNLYILRSGSVDVAVEMEGESIKLIDLSEGAQFGDMSFIAEELTNATITAGTDCEVYRITRDAFSQLFVYHQSVARDLTFSIMRNMSSNLKRMNRQRADHLRRNGSVEYSGA